jgi:hypothetical protein
MDYCKPHDVKGRVTPANIISEQHLPAVTSFDLFETNMDDMCIYLYVYIPFISIKLISPLYLSNLGFSNGSITR